MKEKTNGYYESQRRAKREYKKRNRDKVNAARSKRRIAKRAELKLQGKQCANCDRFLIYSPKASIRFCETCRRDNPKEVRALEPKNVAEGRRLPAWKKVKETKVSCRAPRRTRKYILQQLSLTDA